MCSAFITCCMFPFLNLTKRNSIRMEIANWLVIVVSIMFYHSIGQAEAKLFPNSSAMFIGLFNLIATIVGMESDFYSNLVKCRILIILQFQTLYCIS